MSSLEGRWKVRRVSGLLPPLGVRKRILARRGWTLVGGLPLLPFRVRGRTLRYWPPLPVRDELVPCPDGTWEGRGLLFGLPFCRFRLEPL